MKRLSRIKIGRLQLVRQIIRRALLDFISWPLARSYILVQESKALLRGRGEDAVNKIECIQIGASNRPPVCFLLARCSRTEVGEGVGSGEGGAMTTAAGTPTGIGALPRWAYRLVTPSEGG